MCYVRRFKTVRPLSMSRNYTVYDICNIQIYCLVSYLLYLLTCLLEHRISLSLEIRLNHFFSLFLGPYRYNKGVFCFGTK